MFAFSNKSTEAARAFIAALPLEKVREYHKDCVAFLNNPAALPAVAKELRSDVAKTKATLERAAALLSERL